MNLELHSQKKKIDVKKTNAGFHLVTMHYSISIFSQLNWIPNMHSILLLY